MAFTKAPISAVITDAIGNTINLGNASGSFTSAPISIVLTDAAGNTLNVAAGVVAKFDATAQASNISQFTLYTTSANGAGMYRIFGYVALTQAATTSSTMPACQVSYVNDSGSTLTWNFTEAGLVSNSIANTDSNQNSNQPGAITFYAQANSAIKVSLTGYASSGATPMQYAVHIKLEYLGA